MGIIKANQNEQQPREDPQEPSTLDNQNEINRILQIKTLITVILAEKTMSVHDVMDIKQGDVLEFEKTALEPLNLEINRKPIAHGSTVKMGEKFGIQIVDVIPLEDKIKALK